CPNNYINPYILDVNNQPLLDITKINYNLFCKLTSNDENILYTIANAPERIGGGFFFLPQNLIDIYQKIYHDKHKEFQDLNLVDDDQHIALRCYYDNKNIFNLFSSGGWYSALEFLQKDKK